MCWKCGKPIETDTFISRTSVCGFCGADLHSCKNCRFYQVGAKYDCHETIDELVKDKEKSNFCGFFSAKSDFSEGTDAQKAALAKAAAQKLFGDLSPDLDAEKNSARDSFNNLFGN